MFTIEDDHSAVLNYIGSVCTFEEGVALLNKPLRIVVEETTLGWNCVYPDHESSTMIEKLNNNTWEIDLIVYCEADE
jgi:hypothetical protein